MEALSEAARVLGAGLSEAGQGLEAASFVADLVEAVVREAASAADLVKVGGVAASAAELVGVGVGPRQLVCC